MKDREKSRAHPLLERQLKRHFGGADLVPEALRSLFAAVDSAYAKADADFALLSHSLEEMSREFNAQNDILRRERDAQTALAKRLENAHNQLLQAEKMASIGQLAAGVAHEINNPIGYVNSNISRLDEYSKQLLEMIAAHELAEVNLPAQSRADLAALRQRLDFDFLKSDLLDLLAESKEGINRVKKIVEDLKEFSHVDASHFAWADLHKGLDSTLNIVANEIKYKADVVKDYGEIPKVECMPSQLNQIFMNLMVNAAHAMSGERRGTITIRTRTAGDGEVCVEISDDGCGIPKEHLQRIFDPFFTTKPVGVGTGLGLSLSYGIMQKHHGRIEVDSTPGSGTTFRLLLPIRQNNPEPA